MKFFIYCNYDPEIESFESRLNLGPLGPEEMAEQYRRLHVKMKEEDKTFMEGKKVVLIGTFDDEIGKIEQGNLIEVYHFKSLDLKKPEIKEEETKGESEGEKCQEHSSSTTEQQDQN